MKAKKLSLESGLVVAQSFYSDWGNFFQKITQYPCALHDKRGFIILENEEHAARLSIRIGKRTNVPHRISNLDGYRIRSASQNVGEVIAELILEGNAVRVVLNRYERDPKARAICIKKHGSVCIACGFKASTVYGEVAMDLIEVHHLSALASEGVEHLVNPETDLVPVCPNCHAVIHLKTPPYTVDEVRAMLNR
jgi:hypothetical protein